MVYRLAADAVLFAHAFFVAFVVGGLALVVIGRVVGWAWIRNPWFRLAHLIAIGIVTLQTWVGMICPLTTLEMALRARAGERTYAGSFVAHWLEDLLYINAPAWMFAVSYTAFALVVVTSWWWATPRPFASRHNAQ